MKILKKLRKNFDSFSFFKRMNPLRRARVLKVTISILTLVSFLLAQTALGATMYCGRDLDGDGKVTGQDETAQCIGPDKTLCPIDAVPCAGVQSDPLCPESTVLNTASDKCEAAPTDITCSSPYIYNDAAGLCVNTVSCPSGSTFAADRDICEKTVEFGCPDNLVYNETRQRCETSPSCQEGTFDAVADRCNTSPLVSCPSGFTYNSSRNLCQMAPSCGSGSTYSAANNRCEKTPYSGEPVYACPYPGSSSWSCEYGCSGGEIPQCGVACAWGGEFGIIWCEQSTPQYCDSGFTLASGVCYRATACSSGSLNGATDMCEIAVTADCPAGFAYDNENNVCYRPAECPSGTFDGNKDVCWQSMPENCPSGFRYRTETGTCELQASTLCPSEDAYSAELDGCTRQPSLQCATGTVYSSQTRMCQANPSCTNGAYYTDLDKCFDDTIKKCPFNWSIPCVDNAGELQCSPNECFDPQGGGIGQEVINENDNSVYTDDGARDENGNCLDQIYIFSGRSMTCQLSGIDSGWQNCCITSDAPLKDTVGSTMDLYKVYTTIKHIYHLGQVIYYTDLALSGTMVDVSALSAEVGTAIEAGVVAEDVTVAIQSYIVAAINPLTIIISAVIFIAMEYFLSGSCTQEDIETAMADSSGRCHTVNTYCVKEWPLAGGCVQEVKTLCCFNSKLARIVHEQGRPQLKTFNPLWGPEEGTGNCRGFTASEFQMLDFSKMNLSEYFDEITSQIKTDIQEQAQEKVNEFYNKTKR